MARPKKTASVAKAAKVAKVPKKDFVDQAEFAMHLVAQDPAPRANPAFEYMRQTQGHEQEQAPRSGSSIPIGEFEDETEGLAPRSRFADTRESNTREKEEFIKRARQNIGARSKGLLDVDADMIPPGFSFLWGRASVRDHPDAANLRQLQKNGWLFATADQMPGLAFYDALHGIRDDAEHIYNDGLVAMLRYQEITDYEDRYYLNASRVQSNSLGKTMKKIDDSEMNPFLSNGRSDPYGNIDLGNSNYDYPQGQNFNGLNINHF